MESRIEAIVVKCLSCGSETTVNYWMMVERYPNLNEEVGDWISGCEISSLCDINLSGGQLPHVLCRWHVDLMSKTIFIFFKNPSCEGTS